MATYKIRTHNPNIGAIVLILMLVVFVFLFVQFDGAAASKRIFEFLNLPVKYSTVIVIFFAAFLLYVCYFSFFTITNAVELTEDTISAVFYVNSSIGEKSFKKLFWTDIVNFSVSTAPRAGETLIIRTKDKNDYRLYHASSFWPQKNFTLLITHLKSKVTETNTSLFE